VTPRTDYGPKAEAVLARLADFLSAQAQDHGRLRDPDPDVRLDLVEDFGDRVADAAQRADRAFAGDRLAVLEGDRQERARLDLENDSTPRNQSTSAWATRARSIPC
jgi:hypothetical protein